MTEREEIEALKVEIGNIKKGMYDSGMQAFDYRFEVKKMIEECKDLSLSSSESSGKRFLEIFERLGAIETSLFKKSKNSEKVERIIRELHDLERPNAC